MDRGLDITLETDYYLVPGGGLEEKHDAYLREYTALTEHLGGNYDNKE